MRGMIRVAFAILILSLSVSAQQAPPLDRLPADTTFFFAWNGIASVDKARATNPLLRMWDDPEFIAARQVLLDRMAREAKTATPAENKALQADLLDLAANPFVLGAIGAPNLKPAAAKSAKAGAKPLGFFFIYDATGKMDQLKRVLASQPKTTADKPVVTKYSFAGTEVTKEVRPAKRSYSSEDGSSMSREVRPESASFSATVQNFYISTDSQETIEKLLRRFTGAAAADSVLTTAAYQAAGPHRAPDAFFELFAKIPDLTGLEIPPAQGMDFAAMLKGLHLERIRAITASGSLTGNSTRIRGAALGDTSAGSLFDLIGASAGEFRTLAVAPMGSSYSATRLDLLAFYQTLRNAARAGLNIEQQSQLEMFEGMMGAQLGMGIGEALAAVSGEVATISLDSDGNGNGGSSGSEALPSAYDPLQNLYAVAISRPDDVLKLVQLVAGKNLTNETREGNATVLAVTMPYRDEKNGVQRKRFHYIGITPNMMIIAPRKALLREAITRASAQSATTATGLAADSKFQQVRTRLPNNLSAISYADLSHTPWQFLFDTIIREAAANAAKDPSEKLTPQEEEALRVLPRILSRYLHTSFGGYWKDKNGIFMDSFIE